MTKLRRRMIEDMEIRNLSPNTQLSYLQQVSGFAKYCHRSKPPPVVDENLARCGERTPSDEHLAS